MLPPRSSTYWTPIVLIQCPTLSFLDFACGFLYSHALLIPTKSSKSKNKVVHEQKLKDHLIAHARLAQKGEYWTLNQRSRG